MRWNSRHLCKQQQESWGPRALHMTLQSSLHHTCQASPELQSLLSHKAGKCLGTQAGGPGQRPRSAKLPAGWGPGERPLATQAEDASMLTSRLTRATSRASVEQHTPDSPMVWLLGHGRLSDAQAKAANVQLSTSAPAASLLPPHWRPSTRQQRASTAILQPTTGNACLVETVQPRSLCTI